MFVSYVYPLSQCFPLGSQECVSHCIINVMDLFIKTIVVFTKMEKYSL